jgi:hypothetical protein
LVPAIDGAPFVDLVEQTDDLGRRGGRNYVGDVVPSGAVLHHATGRDPSRTELTQKGGRGDKSSACPPLSALKGFEVLLFAHGHGRRDGTAETVGLVCEAEPWTLRLAQRRDWNVAEAVAWQVAVGVDRFAP